MTGRVDLHNFGENVMKFVMPRFRLWFAIFLPHLRRILTFNQFVIFWGRHG